MKVPSPSLPALEAFARLLGLATGVRRKFVFGNPAAFAQGKMAFGVFGPDLFFRVPPTERESALATPGARILEPFEGRRMSEYVVVPIDAIHDTIFANAWVRRAVAAAQDASEGASRTVTTRAKAPRGDRPKAAARRAP